LKGTYIAIRETKKPFAHEEAHLVDATLYTQFKEDARFLMRSMEGVKVSSIRERMGL